MKNNKSQKTLFNFNKCILLTFAFAFGAFES
jgi:hypothetical protein